MRNILTSNLKILFSTIPLLSSLIAFGQTSGQESYQVTIKDDSIFLDRPTPEFFMDRGTIAHRVDLNFDDADDLIVYFGNCGNGGDCIYGFFVSQGPDRHKGVFEDYLPYFILSDTAATVDGSPWRKFTVFDRSMDKDDNVVVVKGALIFDGEVYRRSKRISVR